MHSFSCVLGVAFVLQTLMSVTSPEELRDGEECFTERVNLEIVCGYPSVRRLPLSEQGCKDLCKEFIVQCRVAQYDLIIKQCDIFSMMLPSPERFMAGKKESKANTTFGWGNVAPVHIRRDRNFFDRRFGYGTRLCGPLGPEIQAAESYKLFVPKESCGGYIPPEEGTSSTTLSTSTTTTPTSTTTTTTTTTTTSTSTTTPVETSTEDDTDTTTDFTDYLDIYKCPDGKEVKFTRVEDRRLKATPDATQEGVSLEECLNYCEQNMVGAETIVPCRSVSYSDELRSCGLSGDALLPRGQGEAHIWTEGDYYEKICINQTISEECEGTFLVAPQMFLAGFAQQVSDAKNLEECMEMCYASNELFSFFCFSGMFYHQDATLNCVLNGETASNNPTLFGIENNAGVDYFEMDCLLPPRAGLSADAPVNSRRPRRGRGKDVLRKQLRGIWGGWSGCDRRDNTRKRFRNCSFTTSNPTNCSVENQNCPLHL